MDGKELVPILESNLARQLHWIASADSKGAFIFSLTAAMLGLLAAVAPSAPITWTIAPAITTAFAVASAFASLVCLSFAAFPRTDGPKASLIYCGGVAQRDANQFNEQVHQLSIDAYTADLALQCHRNAVIACEKFKWVQRAMISLYISLVPWALSVWLLYSVAT